MAPTGTGTDGRSQAVDPGLRAILALLVDARERALGADKTPAKTELLLSAAGLPIDDIVAVTGKRPDAVRKTIQRAKGK